MEGVFIPPKIDLGRPSCKFYQPKPQQIMDTRDKKTRSYIMSQVKSKNTGAELNIRKELHRSGLRYRLHVKELPGTPDLVFPKYKSVLFVHGCFWHGHKCPKGRLPKSNIKFWKNKILKNQERDVKNQEQLKSLGYSILVLWQCSVLGKNKKPIQLIGRKVKKWLLSGKPSLEI